MLMTDCRFLLWTVVKQVSSCEVNKSCRRISGPNGHYTHTEAVCFNDTFVAVLEKMCCFEQNKTLNVLKKNDPSVFLTLSLRNITKGFK